MKKTIALITLAAAILFMASESKAQEPIIGKYKKCLVIGAHPDDPESMCGGTMLLLKEQGCEVVSVYFTSGERGIPGKGLEETKKIRQAEAREACKVMGIRPVFMSQVDGGSVVNQAAYDEMKQLILDEKPDLVITHWPIDSHRDHRNCSILVYDAWRLTGHSFDLYYGEVMIGLQTQNFTPTVYVNIDKTVEKKREAYLCHKSQGTDGNIEKWHDIMDVLRGREFQCNHAESFIKQRWNSSELLDR